MGVNGLLARVFRSDYNGLRVIGQENERISLFFHEKRAKFLNYYLASMGFRHDLDWSAVFLRRPRRGGGVCYSYGGSGYIIGKVGLLIDVVTMTG